MFDAVSSLWLSLSREGLHWFGLPINICQAMYCLGCTLYLEYDAKARDGLYFVHLAMNYCCFDICSSHRHGFELIVIAT